MTGETTWEKIEKGLWRANDSCAVYAIAAKDGWVVINAGTGATAQSLARVKKLPVKALLLTHHFRDHSAGAAQWKESGAEIWAPYWEQEYLVNPKQHWIERQIWNSYDNRWDRMAPIEPIPVDRWLMDYAKVNVAGLDIEIVPTPGVSNGAVSFVFELNGRVVAAVGETIHSPGKMYRIAPLQYDYNDFNGSYNVHRSLDRLRAFEPELALPSFGEPIPDPSPAFEALKKNLERFKELTAPLTWFTPLEYGFRPYLDEFFPGFFFIQGSGASTHFLRTKTGKTIAIDYGYDGSPFPMKSHRSNHRPLLLCRNELIERFGTDRIDMALISHYHDDHVNGIPMLQRLYGTEVWAGENFADILEQPARHDRPCLWHEPITVHRRCPMYETLEWEGVAIRLHPTCGHTLFGTLIELEIDGTRFVHTGDQVFFSTPDKADLACYPNSRLFTNHVYKNGIERGGYHQTLEHLERIKPDWVLTGHTPPYRMVPDMYRIYREGADRWEAFHEALMPIGESEPHFGVESQPAKLFPYRTELDAAEPIHYEAWVMNPFPEEAEAVARLVGPVGWESPPVSFKVGPRQKAAFTLTLEPPSGVRCLRQPVALDLVVNGKPFGQVAEALVSIGEGRSWYLEDPEGT